MQENVTEEKNSLVVIDLNSLKGKELNEFINPYRMFGEGIKTILKSIFGGAQVPVKVRGTRSDINSFVQTIAGEKKHLEAIRQYGLDNPNTFKSRYQLDRAVSQFERRTGIPWPFK